MDDAAFARYSLDVDESGRIAGMQYVQAHAAYLCGSALIGKVLTPPTRWQRFKRWVRSIW